MDVTEPNSTISRSYTAAMLAELCHVPSSAIRHWQRRGWLIADRVVQRLAHFDLSEVPVAQRLAGLVHAGCSLKAIDRKLAALARQMPGNARPIADPRVVVDGQLFLIQRESDFAEPHGQLVLGFEEPDLGAEGSAILPFELSAEAIVKSSSAESSNDGADDALGRLQQMAIQREAAGEWSLAVDAYRGILALEGPAAETNFALGDLFYKLGDLSAARERYFMAIELDESFVEARANLGCVLAEMGEFPLAVAALEGALYLHPEYADVHFHLATVFDKLQRFAEAEMHWSEFLKSSPDGPWADLARERLQSCTVATECEVTHEA